MGYFQVSRTCANYPAEWDAVVTQIRQWPLMSKLDRNGFDVFRLIREPPGQGIEAKALYIFTVARRLIRSAWQLAKANQFGWNPVFIETSSLLFPMIELVGEARKALGTQELGAGIQWLQSPGSLPSRTSPIDDKSLVSSLTPYMNGKPAPRVCDLYYLRNYYLHGLKNVTDRSVPIADIINAELPYAIIQQSENAVHIYWEHLKQDKGTHEWINRLAQADIRPFVIQGSELFEAGLVDPDIVDYLEDFNATVCK